MSSIFFSDVLKGQNYKGKQGSNNNTVNIAPRWVTGSNEGVTGTHSLKGPGDALCLPSLPISFLPFSYYVFLRQDLTVQSRLALNSQHPISTGVHLCTELTLFSNLDMGIQGIVSEMESCYVLQV